MNASSNCGFAFAYADFGAYVKITAETGCSSILLVGTLTALFSYGLLANSTVSCSGKPLTDEKSAVTLDSVGLYTTKYPGLPDFSLKVMQK